MSDYSALQALIDAYIKQNGNNEITGQIMNSVLNAIVDKMGTVEDSTLAEITEEIERAETAEEALAEVITTITSTYATTEALQDEASARSDADQTLQGNIDTLDSAAVHKTGNETIEGVKTFTDSPVVPTPSSDTDAANKKYVDDGLGEKQDTISDLATIRSGAALGATAVQPATLSAGLATKQDALTFDTTPTSGSTNPVTSDGVYDAIASLPDEEDITLVNSKLKFKDRDTTNGMGYVILRTDKTFAEQVTAEDTIYEIRYDFDLESGSVVLPDNCILKFVGGSVSNGTLNNVGRTEGTARDGFLCDIGSFVTGIETIKASDYGVTGSSDAEHNTNVLQMAIDSGFDIIIDYDGEVGYDSGIQMAEPLYITKSVSIKGDGAYNGCLYFPSTDGIVFNTVGYFAGMQFDNLTVTAYGNAFDFCNADGSTRPRNIYQTLFTNIRVKSTTENCFYGGNMTGYAGDQLLFQCVFRNIYLWTSQYGFYGILGQLTTVVDTLTDSYVGESFFYNTCPTLVTNVNSCSGYTVDGVTSYTNHFMVFDDSWNNYSTTIKCVGCNWESYAGEIFIHTGTVNYSFALQLSNCSFGYDTDSINDGNGLNFYPINLSRVGTVEFDKVSVSDSLTYEDGYCLMYTQQNTKPTILMSNIDIDIVTPSYTEAYRADENSSFNLVWGSYYVQPKKALANNGLTVTDGLVLTPQVIKLSANNTSQTITSNFVKFQPTANDYQIGSILFDPSDDLGISYSASRLPFLFLWNDSDYRLWFNSGYTWSARDFNEKDYYIAMPHELLFCIPDEQSYRYRIVEHFCTSRRLIGSTANRPSGSYFNANRIGYQYYDTTLKQPIWWNGSAWTDATGTSL